jgi:prophage regulatory protein
MSREIWRLPRVLSYNGSSRSSFYTQIATGLWPRPVSLGERAVGWPANEVEQMVAARIAGLDADALRQLARKLEAKRRQYADQ